MRTGTGPKALLIALVMPAVALAMALVPLAARADSSQQLHIQGIVPQNCTVSILDRGVVLDLGANSQSRSVASIDEQCNAPSGYTVTLASRNGGELRQVGTTTTTTSTTTASGTQSAVAYSMVYEGGTATGTGTVVAQRSGPQNVVHDLAIDTRPASGLPAGSYDDTVTVTIQAK